jgi:hypothetical protein
MDGVPDGTPGDGKISFVEFSRVVNTKLHIAMPQFEAALRKMFSKYDSRRRGALSVANVSKLMGKMFIPEEDVSIIEYIDLSYHFRDMEYYHNYSSILTTKSALKSFILYYKKLR